MPAAMLVADSMVEARYAVVVDSMAEAASTVADTLAADTVVGTGNGLARWKSETAGSIALPAVFLCFQLQTLSQHA
jgi:hypothetical protein